MSPIVLAINLAEEKMKGELNSHEAQVIPNMKEVARIWRVYLMSEFTDSFGAMPIEAFAGKTRSLILAKKSITLCWMN